MNPTRAITSKRIGAGLSFLLFTACATASRDPQPAPVAVPAIPAPAPPPAEPLLERFTVLVPGSTEQLELVPIPAGVVAADDGAGGRREVAVGPLFVATTEVTWDMYDAFVFAMDRAEGEKDPPDAWARPSKPYILMDRGFGHAGYPAISVSFRGASEFAKWLSAKTGRPFRLPTETEWEHAARAGSAGAYAHGDEPAGLDTTAWFRANSITGGRPSTHAVGKKAANAWGLFDVHGNAAEWTVAESGTGVLRGGSFKDPAAKLGLGARVPDDKAFNQTDPQLPKSVWWLADGPFAGFRVACDP